jgi:26S proteasome regulatory subunit N5
MLVTLVQLCFEAKYWNQLNEKIIDLVKKRAQLKQAVAKMVTECCTFLDK